MLKSILFRFNSSARLRDIAVRGLSNQSAPIKSPSPVAQESIFSFINKKSTLELVIADGFKAKGCPRILSFNAHWLRFNCHSEKSKQPGSGQRTIDIDSVPVNLGIDAVEQNGNDVIIKWDKAANQPDTILPLDFLISNYPSELYNEANQSRSRFKSSKTLKEFEYESFFDQRGNKKQEAIFEWIKCIAEYGICLLKGVPAKDRMVKNVAELIAPIQQTIYDEIFDVKAEKNPINIAYSDVALGFHMDLMYYESSPGLQFLHCLKFDEQIEGGSSLFVDTFEVAEHFRAKYPTLFANLARIPATFQKIHMERKRPVCMVYQRPHIILNKNDQIIAVNWAPPFEGPLQNLSQDDIKAYYESYIEFSRFLNNHTSVIKHRLRPGEVACFNNRRILHARDGFKSNNGERHLQGCYINIDEFKSESLVQEYYSMINSGKLKKSDKIDPRVLTLQSVVYGNHDHN